MGISHKYKSCWTTLERTGECFKVKVWGNANGGSSGDAHGRAVESAQPGTFEAGDRLLVKWGSPVEVPGAQLLLQDGEQYRNISPADQQASDTHPTPIIYCMCLVD